MSNFWRPDVQKTSTHQSEDQSEDQYARDRPTIEQPARAPRTDRAALVECVISAVVDSTGTTLDPTDAGRVVDVLAEVLPEPVNERRLRIELESVKPATLLLPDPSAADPYAALHVKLNSRRRSKRLARVTDGDNTRSSRALTQSISGDPK